MTSSTNYLVLARKYRPGSFAEVKGQEHVTKSLSNAITRSKVGQAYLFAGPRGVGKTSIARIFAKSLNCISGPTPTPCQSCSACLDITNGRSLAVWEVDGASHNSVDNVRDLIDSFRLSPPPGYRYKLYIIDEVHMLSISAFNALLKSLEEPPPKTVFILATTEAHKIPDTVLSRCQRFDLRALTGLQIEDQLTQVAGKEQISIDKHALRLISRLAEGSMRDAETILERVSSFCDESVTAEAVSQVVGVTSRASLFSLSEAILSAKPATVLSLISRTFENGADEAFLIKELVAHWRELFLTKISKDSELLLLGIRQDEIVEARRAVESVSAEDLQDLYRVLRDGCDLALRSAFSRQSLEALLVRMALRVPLVDFSKLLELVSSKSIPSAQQIQSLSSNSQVQSKPAPKVIEVESKPDKLVAINEATVSLTAREAPKQQSLDFDLFIGFIASKGSRILSEQLKRFTVEKFSDGELLLTGSDFNIKAVKRDNSLLSEYLSEFSVSLGNPKTTWRVACELATVKTQAFLTESNLLSKPPTNQVPVDNSAFESIQKIFPDSRLEAVKESRKV